MSKEYVGAAERKPSSEAWALQHFKTIVKRFKASIDQKTYNAARTIGARLSFE
jgi:hypothetical protein